MPRSSFRPACELIVSTPADTAITVVVEAFGRGRFRQLTSTLPIALRYGSVVANTVSEMFLPPLNMLPALQAGTVVITTAEREDATTSVMVALRNSSSLWLMNERVMACVSDAVAALIERGLLIEAKDPVPSITLPKGHPGRARVF